MAKAAVGAARIEMSINSATFEQQMEQARKATSRFSKSAKNVSKQFNKMGKRWQSVGKSLMQNITAPMVGAVGGLIALQKQTGNYADRLLDLEQITGISTTALQEWRNVARIAGVESDALSNAATGLTRRMKQISNESGAAYTAAEKLGVSFKDSNGNMRDTESVMSEAIGKLSQMESGLERSALANDLFGRRWEQIAPILGMGADEIENAKDQAHEMGSVMSREALEAANKFRIKMGELTEMIKAGGRSLAVDLLPLVQDKLIPLFEKGMKYVGGLTEKFTKLDTESQVRIAKIVAAVGLLPPVIFGVGAAFVGVATVISTLLTPIGAVIVAVGGLAAAVVYVADNWAAIKERISDITWWRNTVIKMLQFFIRYNTFGVMIEGFNAVLRHFGQSEIPNPFEKLAGSLDHLKVETPKYKTNFGSFMDAVHSGVEGLTGFNISEMLNLEETNENLKVTTKRVKEANSEIQKMMKSIGYADTPGKPATLTSGITPPTARGTDERSVGIYGHRRSIEKMEQKMAELRQDFRSSTNETEKKNIRDEIADLELRIENATQVSKLLNDVTNTWVNSFGQGMSNIVLEGTKFVDVLKDMKKLLLSSAIQSGISAILTGGLAGSGFFGTGGGLIGKIIGVNDALVRSDGSVIRFHPDDDLLAMKDFGDLGKQFERPTGGGGGSMPPIEIHNVMQMDSMVVWRGLNKLDRRRQT